MTELPRIETIANMGWPRLGLQWRDDPHVTVVSLGGWIMTGGDTLAPLKDPKLFAEAAIGEHSASVYWGDPDGDLAIDALHLRKLADEQRPFLFTDLIQWQQDAGLSNQESADFFQVSLSTWNLYKAGAAVPAPIGMLCRAAKRDPILMQAHYVPRRPGRPRKDELLAR